jgi:hypothetical protein
VTHQDQAFFFSENKLGSGVFLYLSVLFKDQMSFVEL